MKYILLFTVIVIGWSHVCGQSSNVLEGKKPKEHFYWDTRLYPDYDFYNALKNEQKAAEALTIMQPPLPLLLQAENTNNQCPITCPNTYANWQPLGPSQIRDGKWNISYQRGLGRMCFVRLHPEFGILNSPNSNTMFAGAANGGLWKSIDEGQNWNLIGDTDRIFPVAVSDLAIHPNNPAIMFLATGNRQKHPSVGLLKSVNGGITWTESALKFREFVS